MKAIETCSKGLNTSEYWLNETSSKPLLEYFETVIGDEIVNNALINIARTNEYIVTETY